MKIYNCRKGTRKGLSWLTFGIFTRSNVRERVVGYKADMTLCNSRAHYKIQIMQNHYSSVTQLHKCTSNGKSSAKKVQNFIIKAALRTKKNHKRGKKAREKILYILLNKFST